MNDSVRNALLHSAILRREQLTTLVVVLHFLYGDGSTQKFGPIPATEHVIRRILDITESSEWSEVANKPVRVRGTTGEIKSVGHFLTDDWLD
jgi:hypothetical protein